MFLVFFAMSWVQTKLDWYLLPIYPALSISVAYYLAKLFKEEQKLFMLGVFIVVMALHLQYSHIFNHDYSRQIKGIAPVAGPVIAQADIVYFYNLHDSPAGNFYLGKKIAYLDDPSVFEKQANAADSFYCFVREKDLGAISHLFSKANLTQQAFFEDMRLVAKPKRL
jgi:hypothetical protein